MILYAAILVLNRSTDFLALGFQLVNLLIIIIEVVQFLWFTGQTIKNEDMSL